MKKIVVLIILTIFSMTVFAEVSNLIPESEEELTDKFKYEMAVFTGEDYEAVYRYLNHGDEIAITDEDDTYYFFGEGNAILAVKKENVRTEMFESYEAILKAGTKICHDQDMTIDYYTLNGDDTVLVVDEFGDVVAIEYKEIFGFVDAKNIVKKETPKEEQKEDLTAENNDSSENSVEEPKDGLTGQEKTDEKSDDTSSTETEQNPNPSTGSSNEDRPTETPSTDDTTTGDQTTDEPKDPQTDNPNEGSEETPNPSSGDGEDISLVSYTEPLPLTEGLINTRPGYIRFDETPVYLTILHAGDELKVLDHDTSMARILINGRKVSVPMEYVTMMSDSYNSWNGFAKEGAKVYRDLKMTDELKTTELNETIKIINELGDKYIVELETGERAYMEKSDITLNFSPIIEPITENTESENSSEDSVNEPEWTEPAL